MKAQELREKLLGRIMKVEGHSAAILIMIGNITDDNAFDLHQTILDINLEKSYTILGLVRDQMKKALDETIDKS
jgi:hypothetical protein